MPDVLAGCPAIGIVFAGLLARAGDSKLNTSVEGRSRWQRQLVRILCVPFYDFGIASCFGGHRVFAKNNDAPAPPSWGTKGKGTGSAFEQENLRHAKPIKRAESHASADSPEEKAEKVRAGKGVVGIVGGIAIMFLIAFVAIIGYAVIFGLTH